MVFHPHHPLRPAADFRRRFLRRLPLYVVLPATLITLCRIALLTYGIDDRLRILLLIPVMLAVFSWLVWRELRAEQQVEGAQSRQHDALQQVAEEVERQVMERTTELAAATHRLGVSEEKYRHILTTIQDGYFEIDLGGNFTLCNPAMADLLGYPPGELAGMSYQRYTDRPEGQRLYHAVNTVFVTGTPLKAFAWEIIRRDGERRHVESSFTVILDHHERPCGFRGIVRDVTEQRTAEKVTGELAAIVACSYDAIYSKTLDGRIVSWNAAAERMFGYRAEEICGQPLERLIPADRPDEYRDIIDRIVQGERIDHFETRRLHKDGRQIHVALTVSPLLDESGRVSGASIIARDIGAEREVQDALQRAKTAAESASRAKSEFLANMSHEIRTPMNGVVGMTELLLNTDPTPEQREYLELMRSSADAMLEVINLILDFSKLEAGKLELKALPFSLRECVEDTLKSLAVSADRKGLELACRIGGEVADTVIGDAGCLRQVLVNLAGNAIKFTERGEVTVSVSAEPDGANRQRLHVEVRDTGVGIPNDKLEMIFDPFSQADGSATRHYGGTGLGLSICRQIVTLMGGTLGVESGPGSGSVFRFTAGLEVQRRRVSRPWQLPAGLGDPQQYPVLLVDDHGASRDGLRDTLEELGLWVIAAESGPAALELADIAARNETPVRLLLIDSQMPGMDGFELVAALRAGAYPKTPVIMLLSPSRQPEESARCRELGLTARLSKPVRTSELREALFTALGGDAARRAAAGAAPSPAADQGPPLRILLAEDNPVSLRYAQRLLEKRGHAVTSAVNGREVLAAHAGGAFDLILMDVQMPEMSGIEATAAIRQMESVSGAHVPVIALTAHSMPGDAERCLAAGMDDVVTKPLRVEALMDAIERNRPDGEAPAAASPARQADLLTRVGGDRTLLAEIAGLFEQDAERQLSRLADAIGRGDAEAIRFTAHSLKGSAANFADVGAVAAAERLESLARGGRLNGLAAAQRHLESEMHRLRAELATVRKEYAP